MVTDENDLSPKERILTFVEDHLLAVGSVRFSVDEVAAGLGMSKKTFYSVFPTKEAMLEALIRRIIGFAEGNIDRIVGGDRTFLEKLSAIAGFMASMVRRLALPLSSDFHRLHPRLWNMVEEFRTQKIRIVFGTLFDQGKAEGYIRPEIDRDIFLLTYAGAIRAVIQPSVLMEHRFTVQDAIAQILTLFFRGALTPAGQEEFTEVLQQLHHS